MYVDRSLILDNRIVPTFIWRDWGKPPEESEDIQCLSREFFQYVPGTSQAGYKVCSWHNNYVGILFCVIIPETVRQGICLDWSPKLSSRFAEIRVCVALHIKHPPYCWLISTGDGTDRKILDNSPLYIFMKNELVGSGGILAYRRTDTTVLIIVPQWWRLLTLFASGFVRFSRYTAVVRAPSSIGNWFTCVRRTACHFILFWIHVLFIETYILIWKPHELSF